MQDRHGLPVQSPVSKPRVTTHPGQTTPIQPVSKTYSYGGK